MTSLRERHEGHKDLLSQEPMVERVFTLNKGCKIMYLVTQYSSNKVTTVLFERPYGIWKTTVGTSHLSNGNAQNRIQQKCVELENCAQ